MTRRITSAEIGKLRDLRELEVRQAKVSSLQASQARRDADRRREEADDALSNAVQDWQDFAKDQPNELTLLQAFHGEIQIRASMADQAQGTAEAAAREVDRRAEVLSTALGRRDWLTDLARRAKRREARIAEAEQDRRNEDRVSQQWRSR